MGLLNFPNASTNPGSLNGASRKHQVTFKNLQADAFRSASQNQETGQAARAFSGSQVSNVNTQTASLSQTATATNTKLASFTSTGATNTALDTEKNLLQKFIAGVDAADLLARGAANIAQNQGGEQSAFAQLNNFSGTDSAGLNNLTQDAQVTQQFDVDLSATVTNTTDATTDGNAFDNARFRAIVADFENTAAQVIFTTGQRQGSAENPFNQTAVGDGGDVTNILAQTATISTIGNKVDLVGTTELDLNETGSDLSHRATDLLIRMKNGAASNSVASSQEQAIAQSAAGGVNEDGKVTENGGSVNVTNNGSSTARTEEESNVNAVTNAISVNI